MAVGHAARHGAGPAAGGRAGRWGSRAGQTAQGAQERVLLEMQKLGLFEDGSGNLNPGQLQGLVAMLNKQGMHDCRSALEVAYVL